VSENQSTSQHEVVIVGAGPAGAALAYFLARAGREVLLLDKAAFPRDKTCGDGLTPRALSVLRHMDLLDPITSAGYRINQLHFYAPNGTPARLSIPAWGDFPTHLVVLPRFKLDHLILQQALRAGAQFRPQTQAVDLLRQGEQITGVAVQSAAGRQELRARYVVLATGAAIGLLERAQLSSGRWQSWRAARGYYEGVSQLEAAVEVHLETAVLPGYAWVFPTSATSANVGAAYLAARGRPAPRSSPRQLVDEFVANPLMASRLARARLNGSIHGYPIRFDFASTPVAFPGLMLIGETAGLVNPLTGEGIDYALESAAVTAETLAGLLRQSPPAADAAAAHTRALRGRFQRTFVTLAGVRQFFLHRWLLNRAARVASHNEAFCHTIAELLLGYIDPANVLTPKIVMQLALG
jgi:geranylgeranyl reductase family protein